MKFPVTRKWILNNHYYGLIVRWDSQNSGVVLAVPHNFPHYSKTVGDQIDWDYIEHKDWKKICSNSFIKI